MTDLSEIQKKLSNVQDKLHAPKSQNNDFGGFNYRSAEDIEAAVKPLLLAEGLLLIVTDELVYIGDRYYIKATSSVHLGDQSISVCSYAREQQVLKGMVEAMITGSTSSYARKYSLGGLFLIDNEADPDALPTDKAAGAAKKPAVEKEWYNDFEKDEPNMVASIASGNATPKKIINKLAKTYKLNKDVRAKITALAPEPEPQG